MNTTHTISDPKVIPSYTVVGNRNPGKAATNRINLGLVLLNRGGRYQRADTFDRLIQYGWNEVLSVESNQPAYDLEELAQRHPGLRFLVMQDQPRSIGEQINLAMREAVSSNVMVIWSYLQPLPMSGRYISDICDSSSVCTAPLFRSTTGEVLPTVCVPASFNNSIKNLYLSPSPENQHSLYPFDYVGIYNKKIFKNLGGYSDELKNPYWQKLDFGFRSFLWGSSIAVHQGFRVQIDEDFEPEDTTPDQDYLTFYLRNLAVEYDKDHGHLPIHAFWEFYRKSGASIFKAISQFRQARHWVQSHAYRFTGEARRLVELWEEEGFNGF
jgi:hypothetical protein